MMSWPERQFRDLLSTPVRNGLYKKEQFRGEGLPIVKMGELFAEDFISGRTSDRLLLNERERRTAVLALGDLLFARRSYVLEGAGKCSLVHHLEGPTTYESSVIRARPNPELANPRFLFYFFKSAPGRGLIQSIATRTAVSGIRGSDLELLRIPTPPVEVQESVAAILAAYDELIENNLRRIEILEEMAQSIYREWFVNLHFPELLCKSLSHPEQWETFNLFDVASVRYGFGFKSKGFHSGPTGRRVVRIRDVPKNTTSTYTDEVPGENYEVTDGDVLVGMDGDFHMCVWHDGEAMLNQRVARFRPKIDSPVLWLFHALKGPIGHFNSTITGTTVAHLGDRHLRTVNLLVPPEPLMILARQQLDPLERLIRNLLRQNANLRTARDLLLPKLVTGEIDISKLDIDTSWLAA